MSLAATQLTGPAFAQATGYALPDEAAPHARSFMQWPVSRRVHPDPVFLDMLQDTIARVANTIVEFEPVVMLMAANQQNRARRKLSARVEIWDIPTEDLWCRDAGPVFLRAANGSMAIANLNFNGWGGRQVHRHDGRIAARVAERMGLPLLDTGVVGESGGLDSDGHGTLIAHESSWVHTNRNHIGRDEIETRLLAALGARKMIWAPGIKNLDITDYHIDSLARFIRPGHVLIQLPDAVIPGDPWSTTAYQTHDILAASTDANGRRLQLSVLPEPRHPRIQSDDFVAAYANYYICNGAVITAEFGDTETDQAAMAALRRAYPGREVIALNVDPLGEVGGGIHCATQQQPAA